MKKHIKLMLLAIGCFIVSGCATFNVGNQVGEDNSFTFIGLYGLMHDDSNLFEPVNEINSMLQEQGYDVRVVDIGDGNKVGQYSLKFDNIEKLCNFEKQPIIILDDYLYYDKDIVFKDNYFKCSRENYKTIFSAHYRYHYRFYDMDSEDGEKLFIYPEDSSEGNEFRTMMLTNYDLKYGIKFDKGTVLSNNATSIDGNTYLWELEPMVDNEILFTFEIPDDIKIDYNDSDINVINDDDIKAGDKVNFNTQIGKKIKTIKIIDKDNNNINYNKVDGKDNEYSFTMPPTEVKITVEYEMDNPKTSKTFIPFIIFGLITGASILLIKGNK